MSENKEVEKFCYEVNKKNLALTINYHSYSDLARGAKEIEKQAYEGLKVAHNIEKFLNEHTFCNACGKRIYEEKKSNFKEKLETCDSIPDYFEAIIGKRVLNQSMFDIPYSKFTCKLCSYSFSVQTFGAPLILLSGDRTHEGIKECMKEHLSLKHNIKI